MVRESAGRGLPLRCLVNLQVSSVFPTYLLVAGRNNKSCRKRWLHSLDPKLRKGESELSRVSSHLSSYSTQVVGPPRRMPFSSNPSRNMASDGTRLPGHSLGELTISVQNATKMLLIHPSVSSIFLSPLHIDPRSLQGGTLGQPKKMNSYGARLKNTETNGIPSPTLSRVDLVSLS